MGDGFRGANREVQELEQSYSYALGKNKPIGPLYRNSLLYWRTLESPGWNNHRAGLVRLLRKSVSQFIDIEQTKKHSIMIHKRSDR